MTALPKLNIPVGDKFGVNLCLQRVRMAWGVPARQGSDTAYHEWLLEGGAHGENTHTEHYQVKGMPIFMKGAGVNGHVCIYDADGYVWTTDWPNRGRWNRVKLTALAKAWNMRVLGGSEVLNGVRVLPHKSY